jgi:hypothetical protein
LGELPVGPGDEGFEVGFGRGLDVFGPGLAQIHDAEIGDAVGEELDADLTLGLENAEFRDGAAEDEMGKGAGAVDGALLERSFVVVERGVDELFFEGAATLEASGGADDFEGEGFFEDAFGSEFGVEGVEGIGVGADGEGAGFGWHGVLWLLLLESGRDGLLSIGGCRVDVQVWVV